MNVVRIKEMSVIGGALTCNKYIAVDCKLFTANEHLMQHPCMPSYTVRLPNYTACCISQLLDIDNSPQIVASSDTSGSQLHVNIIS